MDDRQAQTLLKHIAALPDGEKITHPEAEALLAMLERYPYFTTAALMLIRHMPDSISPEQVSAIQNRLAVTAPCARTLAFAMHGDEWAKFYPPLQASELPETTDVIDTFLRTYGACTPEEEKMLEQMIFNPTPDYAELLARQEQEELPEQSEEEDPLSQDARINAFIRSQHPASPAHHTEPEMPDEDTDEHVSVNKPEPGDDSLLSESLAHIFIKQGRYERAYEIISGISLKYPKKSAYFADQLRFLQKLIINQRRLSDLAGQGAADK